MHERASHGRLGWLLSPATEGGRPQDVGFLVLRITLGMMWFYNVAWKRAPNFGEDAGNGLYQYTKYAVDYPVLAPYAWVVDNLVLPAIVPFGYAVIVAETAAAVLLLTGAHVRIGALIGLGQSVAIGLSVMYAPNEWPWSYWLMAAGHVALLLGATARWGSLDAAHAQGRRPVRQGHVWAVVAALVGVVALVASLDEPFAALGADLRDTDPSLSVGAYNAVGAVVLLVLAGLLVLAARGSRQTGLAGAALGGLAALSLHAQLGFTDPILGGTPSSAAAYLCLAVVAAALAATPHQHHHPDTPSPTQETRA